MPSIQGSSNSLGYLDRQNISYEREKENAAGMNDKGTEMQDRR
jgi:hypothetical protein